MSLLGQTYALTTVRAAVQRSINWMPRVVEAAEKSPLYLEQCPGLVAWSDLGSVVRGMYWTGSRLFAVVDSTLWEVSSSGTGTSRGTLSTSTGLVDFAHGTTQLVIVDGPNGYVLTLASNAFAAITGDGWLGSERIGYIDGFFIAVDPGSQQFYWNANLDDATTWDATEFASASSAPDDIVAVVVDHREIWFLGEFSTELWYLTGNGESPFERNSGTILDVGCAATHSAQKMDNRVFWLGQDRNGSGMVYMADGYIPRRISTHAIEEMIRGGSDLSASTAWTYQQDGQSFYVLAVPGLATTLVYDVSAGMWHERAELISGDLAQWRGVCRAHAFRQMLIGGSDGVIYRLDPTVNLYGSDVLYRERTSPHVSAPTRNRVTFSNFRLDVTVGEVGQSISPVIELSYSDDGGKTWGNWLQRSTGAVGRYWTQVEWRRLGQARDRVWKIRCTDNAKAAIVGVHVAAQEGTA